MKILAFDAHDALLEVENDEPPLFASFKAIQAGNDASVASAGVYEPASMREGNETANDAAGGVLLPSDTVVSALPPFTPLADDWKEEHAPEAPPQRRPPPPLVIILLAISIGGSIAMFSHTAHPHTPLPVAISSPTPIVSAAERPSRLRPRPEHHVQDLIGSDSPPVAANRPDLKPSSPAALRRGALDSAEQRLPSPRPSPLNIPTVVASSKAPVALPSAPLLLVTPASSLPPSAFTPSIFSVSASPSHIQRGKLASICVSARAYKLFLSPTGGQSRYPVTCFPVRPSKTATYIVTAINASGESTRRSVTVIVTVSAPTPVPVILISPATPSPTPRGKHHHRRRRATFAPTAVPMLEPAPTPQ